jgi:hypothetical protein
VPCLRRRRALVGVACTSCRRACVRRRSPRAHVSPALRATASRLWYAVPCRSASGCRVAARHRTFSTLPRGALQPSRRFRHGVPNATGRRPNARSARHSAGAEGRFRRQRPIPRRTVSIRSERAALRLRTAGLGTARDPHSTGARLTRSVLGDGARSISDAPSRIVWSGMSTCRLPGAPARKNAARTRQTAALRESIRIVSNRHAPPARRLGGGRTSGRRGASTADHRRPARARRVIAG